MSANVWRRNGSYTWRGRTLDSVTTVLGTMGKPALIQWAADTAADAAIQCIADGRTLDRDELRKAHLAKRNAAGDRGTSIHEIADALAAGRTVDREAVPPNLRPYFDGLTAFLSEHEVATVWSEKTVASEYGYAGTLDRLATLDGALRVLDFKTRESADKAIVWLEVRLQTAAYARADVALNLDGTEEPLPTGIVGGACVSLYPGGYALDLIDDPDGKAFEAFLSLLEVYRWQRANQPRRDR